LKYMKNESQFNMTTLVEAEDVQVNKKTENPERKEGLSKKYFEEREDVCVYLGVEVPKGEGGDLVPNKSAFENYYLTKEDYILRREIATSLVLNKPLLLEGGTGIGKTSAVANMCADLNTNYCKVAFGRNTTVEDVIGNKDVDIVDGKEVFLWHDGKLLKAIREGGIAFLDEYNFQGSKIAGHVNPIIDAILNGYKTVSIPENNHEQVTVHPNFRLVAAQNPPGTEEGQEFPGREVLGSETFGRWAYHKMPLKMSKEMRLNRRKGTMGKKIGINITDSEFRFLGNDIPTSELIDIPGMEHWAEKSVEIIEMLEEKSSGAGKDMAKDQRQKLSFNPRLEQGIDRYVAKFYRGDVNQVWSDALEYFLVNMYKSDIDKEKVREAIRQSYYIPPKTESKRKGLDENDEEDEEKEKQDLIDRIKKAKGEIPSWIVGDTEDSSVKAEIETAPSTPEFAKAKLELQKSETEAIKKYFGKTAEAIEVPPIPAEITAEQFEFWKNNKFKLHYSPGIEIKKDNEFPGMKERLSDNIYEWMKKDDKGKSKINIDSAILPKGWILIDERPKPQYDNGNQMYEDDILAPVLEDLRKKGLIAGYKEKGSRNVSNDEFNKPEVKETFAKALKIKPEQLELPKAVLFNYIGNKSHPEWGNTNTWEWFQDEYTSGSRLNGGDSGNGGLSYADYASSGFRFDSLGFRPSVRFSV